MISAETGSPWSSSDSGTNVRRALRPSARRFSSRAKWQTRIAPPSIVATPGPGGETGALVQPAAAAGKATTMSRCVLVVYGQQVTSVRRVSLVGAIHCAFRWRTSSG